MSCSFWSAEKILENHGYWNSVALAQTLYQVKGRFHRILSRIIKLFHTYLELLEKKKPAAYLLRDGPIFC